MTGKKESMEQIIKRMEGYGSGNNPRKIKAEAEEKVLSATAIMNDYFVGDLQGFSFKDDAATMEAPIFALSAQEEQKIWKWTSADGKKKVEVAASAYGRATIFDKDVLIFAASQLMAAINRGDKPFRKIRFKAKDYFKATKRNGGGEEYARFKASLDRLSGTRIKTNINTTNIKKAEGFGIIDNWKIIEQDGSERMVSVEITLSEWLYGMIIEKDILTINEEYFLLRKPLERRLYEIARKHLGVQKEWKISLDVLKEKCGSIRDKRNFKVDIKKACTSDAIPDYRLSLDDNEIILFVKK